MPVTKSQEQSCYVAETFDAIIYKLVRAQIDAILRYHAEAEKTKTKFKLIYFESGFKLLLGYEKTHKFLLLACTMT